jgi:hypothetical protein
MGPEAIDFGGIPPRPITFDGPFGGPYAWLLLAFALFVLGALLWSVVSSLRERLTLEIVHCPLRRRRAYVFVRRTHDGRFVAVQRCSLLSPPTQITCNRACRPQIGT